MKNMIIFLLLFGGCASAPVDGVYVRHVESEYTVGEDTLFIRGNALERHTGYRRISNGQLSAKQLKLQHSTITLVSGNRWQDNKTGTTLVFSADKVLLGVAEYQKIK